MVLAQVDSCYIIDMRKGTDFAARLAEAVCASEKLALLRGFFFWLQVHPKPLITCKEYLSGDA